MAASCARSRPTAPAPLVWSATGRRGALYVSLVGPCPVGTATLEYEDGDIEESVPRDFIRPLDRAPPAAAAGDAAGGSGAAGPSAAGTSAAGASAAAAADAVALVEDESLFADDDFPEDDELGAAAAPAAGKAPAAGGKAPAAAVDLNAVDESLFLDEDLPSDDD